MDWPPARVLQDCIAFGHVYVPSESELRDCKTKFYEEEMTAFRLFVLYLSTTNVIYVNGEPNKMYQNGDVHSYATSQWILEAKMRDEEKEAYEYVVKTQ